MRHLAVMVIAGVALVAAACGGEPASPPAPPGSPENPAVAEPVEAGYKGESATAAGKAQPGYEALVEGQSTRPDERFSPCNLVTAAQARAILSAPIRRPLEAPQGPTCIYRRRNGDGFVTVAVQTLDFSSLKRAMSRRRQVEVSDRTAYCGTHGQPMLYMPLGGSRVLSIGAPCATARQFAVKAVSQLTA